MIAYWLYFNILTKNFKVFNDFNMKKAPEVDKPTLGVWMNYFQFQNKDTLNWNFIGFSISNDSLLTEFLNSDKKVWDFMSFPCDIRPGTRQSDSQFLNELFSIPK